MARGYKKVLVTGSTNGIGLETSKKLLKLGYFVIFHGSGRNMDNFLKLSEQYPNQSSFWEWDLINDPEESLSELLNKHKPIYGLVNNAGVMSEMNFFESTYENLTEHFKVNSFAPFVISKVFFNYINHETGGRIINISSNVVKFGTGRNFTIQYASAKASIESLTVGLAKLGASKGILVNAIRPGCILTKMQSSRPDFKKRVDMIPLKRMGSESEISSLIEYLLSDSASFVTGQVISVSGGE